MQKMNAGRNVFIIFLIALVNMLGYGIVIPILYGYSQKFGISDFQQGLLVALFSICQFISTPIIGRLSDKYGRRPMLILSIVGTAISFVMMAFSPNVIIFALARALDGLTAGNIPVALAVISDSTKPEERAKAFGRIGSAFSLGFILGPAISFLTADLWGPLPFLIAAAITTVAVIITFIYLPETNPHLGQVKKEKLFDFPKMGRMLFDPEVGTTFVITLIFFLAFACSIVYGFQPYTMNELKLTESQNSLLFSVFGTVGFIAQNFLVGSLTKKWGQEKAFSVSLLFTAISVVIMGFSGNVPVFVFSMVLMALFNSFVQTLIPTILSQEAPPEEQGSIMGLNASYQSIGFIFGPIIGGALATAVGVPAPFVLGGLLLLSCFVFSLNILRPHKKGQI